VALVLADRSRRGVSVLLFFAADPATTEIYTLSLHDALPISGQTRFWPYGLAGSPAWQESGSAGCAGSGLPAPVAGWPVVVRRSGFATGHPAPPGVQPGPAPAVPVLTGVLPACVTRRYCVLPGPVVAAPLQCQPGRPWRRLRPVHSGSGRSQAAVCPLGSDCHFPTLGVSR